ncbi:MAG TPA: IS110 family transposase [Actinomycetes bacterium]|nr:IS110 family transposase [Actinomycetes bacterium]
MAMLADSIDLVIGVDTHKATHTAALVGPTGVVLDTLTCPTDRSGLDRLLRFGRRHPTDRRLWVLEGTGCYGAGLTEFLTTAGEAVAEIDRPRRPARRHGARSDPLDAVRAAREALGRDHLGVPRRRGEREALRVLLVTREAVAGERRRALNQLHALIVSAPDELRAGLRSLHGARLVRRCAGLRQIAGRTAEAAATVQVIRLTARRIGQATAMASELGVEIKMLVRAMAPQLLTEPGVGPLTAGWLLVAWSHAGRVRSEAAFAMLAGAAPIPASSGQTVRHRLNRSGDRILNRTLHTIVQSRLRHDPDTQAYAARRRAEGRTDREITRCLKRFVARGLYRTLERTAKG